MSLHTCHNTGNYKKKGGERKVITEKKRIKEETYPSFSVLPTDVLGNMCIHGAMKNKDMCSNIKFWAVWESQLFKSILANKKCVWSPRTCGNFPEGSSSPSLLLQISERLKDQLLSSASPHCFREQWAVEAGWCMKPLVLMVVLSIPFIWPALRPLLCMWQRRQQWVQTLSFFVNMCALLRKLWNICHNFTVSSCG